MQNGGSAALLCQESPLIASFFCVTRPCASRTSRDVPAPQLSCSTYVRARTVYNWTDVRTSVLRHASTDARSSSGHLDESSCSCASLGAQACFLSTLFCHWRGPRPTLQQRRSRAPARLLAIPAPQRAATPRHLAASSPQPRCAHRP